MKRWLIWANFPIPVMNEFSMKFTWFLDYYARLGGACYDIFLHRLMKISESETYTFLKFVFKHQFSENSSEMPAEESKLCTAFSKQFQKLEQPFNNDRYIPGITPTLTPLSHPHSISHTLTWSEYNYMAPRNSRPPTLPKTNSQRSSVPREYFIMLEHFILPYLLENLQNLFDESSKSIWNYSPPFWMLLISRSSKLKLWILTTWTQSDTECGSERIGCNTEISFFKIQCKDTSIEQFIRRLFSVAVS